MTRETHKILIGKSERKKLFGGHKNCVLKKEETNLGSGFNWLVIGSNGTLLWIRQSIFVFHKRRKTSWPSERLPSSQGLSFMESVNMKWEKFLQKCFTNDCSFTSQVDLHLTVPAYWMQNTDADFNGTTSGFKGPVLRTVVITSSGFLYPVPVSDLSIQKTVETAGIKGWSISSPFWGEAAEQLMASSDLG